MGLAAVVDTPRYLRWQNRRRQEDAEGLYGRKDIARRIGAAWSDLPVYQTPRYALLHNPALPDLPSLLAVYLAA